MTDHPRAAFLLVVAVVVLSLAAAVHAIPLDTIIRGVKAALALATGWLVKDLAIGVLSVVLAHRATTTHEPRENAQVREPQPQPRHPGRETV